LLKIAQRDLPNAPFRLRRSAERHRHFAFGPRREDIGLKVIASIQCLRAIAALSVVVVHASDHAAGLSGNRHFGEVGTIGAAGVDVFFVISGFIMYVTACSRPITGLHFLADRFSRIVPLYWVATFLLMAVVVAGKTPPPPLSYLLASMALVPVDPQPYLGVGWTLVYEMFFYGMLAAALMWRPRHVAIVTFVMLLLVMAGAVSRPEWVVAKIYTGPLLLEFLAGIWLGIAWSRGTWISPAAGIGLIVVAAIGLAGAFAFDVDTGPYSRLLARGLPAAIIVVGSLSLERLPGVKNRLALLLGAASYAIYLSHPAVLVFIHMVCAKVRVTEPWTILVVSLAMTTAAGIAFHLLVERRLVATTRSALYRLMGGTKRVLFVEVQPAARLPVG
jgi:exopolysaccharide production protein ExoZ